MDISDFPETFDATVDAALGWLGDNAQFVFDGVRSALDTLYAGVLWTLDAPPFYVVASVLGAIAWRLVGAWSGLLTAAALALCAAMGLWPETAGTMALVATATALALLVAVPLGVVAGLVPSLDHVLEPVMDLVQTLPPYIYLLPAIALLGYGSATALVATVIVAVPPALRLTSLGIRRTPREFIELGQASGVTGWQMFVKVRLPFAIPSIMAGINQSLMLAFGMVVIAGIVGSGGLGETIYKAIRTLDIARSVDAAVAIVILTIILDRITQGAARLSRSVAP